VAEAGAKSISRFFYRSKHLWQTIVESYTSDREKVEVRPIAFPKLSLGSRKCEHGVILKTVSTNICGSDQHMVRGRTTAPVGMVLGHEITGEIVEKGRDVEFLNVGDLVSVPFNSRCGRLPQLAGKARNRHLLERQWGSRWGAFGYVDMVDGSAPGRLRDGALCRFQPPQIP